jgi:hypothetical protein
MTAAAAAAAGEVVGRREGGTAGACVARAVSGFPGGGFEFLLGPFCVPPKLTLCFQFFFSYIYLPSVSPCDMIFVRSCCLLFVYLFVCFVIGVEFICSFVLKLDLNHAISESVWHSSAPS